MVSAACGVEMVRAARRWPIIAAYLPPIVHLRWATVHITVIPITVYAVDRHGNRPIYVANCKTRNRYKHLRVHTTTRIWNLTLCQKKSLLRKDVPKKPFCHCAITGIVMLCGRIVSGQTKCEPECRWQEQCPRCGDLSTLRRKFTCLALVSIPR